LYNELKILPNDVNLLVVECVLVKCHEKEIVMEEEVEKKFSKEEESLKWRFEENIE